MSNQAYWCWSTPIVVMLAAAGCGEDPSESSGPAWADQPSCLSCDVVLEEEWEIAEADPRVSASPEQLLFFPTGGIDPEYEPKEVLVQNTLPYVVYVTQAYVSGPGADYFVVDPPLEEWVAIKTNEAVIVDVRFLGSDRQREAVLDIHTTALGYDWLTVSLFGKTFLD